VLEDRTNPRSTPTEQHPQVGLADGEHLAHLPASQSLRPRATLRPGSADAAAYRWAAGRNRPGPWSDWRRSETAALEEMAALRRARCRAVPPSHVSSALLGDFTTRNRRRGPGRGDVRGSGLRELGEGDLVAYRNRLRGSFSLPTGERRRTLETVGDRAPWASPLSLPMAKIIRPARTSVVTPIPFDFVRRTTSPSERSFSGTRRRHQDHRRQLDPVRHWL
jgi:hypothetical protein